MVYYNSSLLLPCLTLLALVVVPSLAGWNRNGGFMVDEVSPRWVSIKSLVNQDNRGIRATDASQQPLNGQAGEEDAHAESDSSVDFKTLRIMKRRAMNLRDLKRFNKYSPYLLIPFGSVKQ